MRREASASLAPSPDDVAEVVALLVSNRSNWMTGANILVDGGMTAR